MKWIPSTSLAPIPHFRHPIRAFCKVTYFNTSLCCSGLFMGLSPHLTMSKDGTSISLPNLQPRTQRQEINDCMNGWVDGMNHFALTPDEGEIKVLIALSVQEEVDPFYGEKPRARKWMCQDSPLCHLRREQLHHHASWDTSSSKFISIPTTRWPSRLWFPDCLPSVSPATRHPPVCLPCN